MGASIDQQVSLTLALAYLSYYTANSPARCSGDHLLCAKLCMAHANPSINCSYYIIHIICRQQFRLNGAMPSSGSRSKVTSAL